MTIFDAIILGLIEGLTEYIPVSSTGHLIIASSLLGLDRDPDTESAVNAFNIVVQGGAILAVLGIFWPRVSSMISGIFGRNPVGLKLFRNIVIAFLPAAVLGVLLDDLIESMLFKPAPVIAALAIGGILLIVMRKWQDSIYTSEETEGSSNLFTDIESLSWQKALAIGFLQCVAMWPGTSRSMMTIVGGMFMGLRPRQAAEFSFLLGLPTLGGACVYKLMKSGSEIASLGWMPVVVGIIVATISAAFAVKWLVNYLSKHGLAIFGWYRIAIAILLAGLWIGGVVQFGPAQAPEDESSTPVVSTEPNSSTF